MKTINKLDLEKIIYGAGFFGGGGGGSLAEGYPIYNEMVASEAEFKIPLVSVDDMEDDDNVVSIMVAALGSPVETKGRTFMSESCDTVKVMIKEAKSQGKELKYIYSGEMGAGNTILPIYVAWKLGMPLLDTDGNGRAVPALDTGLLPIYKIPTSPFALASEEGDTMVVSTKDPLDSKACEKIARSMCQIFNFGIGFATWVASKSDHKKATAENCMSQAIRVGDILMNSQRDTVLDRLEEEFGGKENFKVIASEAFVENIEIDSAGGFDTGTLTLKTPTGETFYVLLENENLVVYNADKEAIATVPNVISLINLEKAPFVPLSNCDIEIGQTVALVVTRANEKWANNPMGYECWREILTESGYDGDEKNI